MADATISFAGEKLGDTLNHKVKFLKGVEEQVRWLKDELESMQCFLKDAAEKQVHDERIRQWISEVDAPTRKRDLVTKWADFPSHVTHLNRVGKELESIRTRLDDIMKRRERYEIGNLGDVGLSPHPEAEQKWLT
ncbi:hypothetical protein ACS0TY_004991 [Phlomoides rotata]